MRCSRGAWLREIGQLYRRARDDGYRDGAAEAVFRCAESVAEARRRRERARTEVVDLVFLIVGRLLGEASDQWLVPAMVRRALGELEAPFHDVTVVVHPAVVEAVAALLEGTPLAGVTVAPNPDLSPTDGYLDLGATLIDIGLHSQLAELRRVAR